MFTPIAYRQDGKVLALVEYQGSIIAVNPEVLSKVTDVYLCVYRMH
jgi:hypothetical protein